MQLSKEEQADLKIASSILTQSFLSEEGEASVLEALNTPEPAKAVAIIIAQLIEMTQTDSADTPIPMSPTVWLMEDGAVDEAEDDIEAIAAANGIELPEDFGEMIVDELAVILQERAKGFQQQEQPSQAPTGLAQQPGGMTNGRMG